MGASPSLWWGQSVMLSALSTRVDTSILHACMLWPLGPRSPWLMVVFVTACASHTCHPLEMSRDLAERLVSGALHCPPLSTPSSPSLRHALNASACARAPPRTRPHVFAARVMVWASKPRASNRRCHETVLLSILRATCCFDSARPIPPTLAPCITVVAP